MPRCWNFFAALPVSIILLFALAGLAPAAPVVASSAITLDQSAVDLSVPLGQALETSIAVTNTSTASIPLSLYEGRDNPTRQQRNLQIPQPVALPRSATRIERGLADLLQAEPDASHEFLVYLRDQADLSAAYGIADWNQRGAYVYQTLLAHANDSQRGLIQQLAKRGLGYRSLWIVNALLIRGNASDVQALATRGEVAEVRLNHTLALADQPQVAAADQCNPAEPANLLCWHVQAVRADAVWRDFGVTGRGVVVANIDTGVAYQHPALVGSYRGRLADGTFDHTYNWFDPQGEYAVPTDNGVHGTHTIGVMVAADSTVSPTVGIAPGARWIAAQGCESLSCNDADLIASAQWLLAPTRPDGSAPRPDLRPMVINNSWASNANDPWYLPYTAAWRAAGIFPVFAAGNASALFPQRCGSVLSPGSYSDVVSVGAVDRAGDITGFSLFGPTVDGRLKPDFVAPGSAVLSTVPPDKGGYQALSGTSMAAPHVAAVVALLWSANPTLIGDYPATYALLRDTAARHDDPQCDDPLGSPNNVYGFGQIDAYAAVAKAKVDVPWLTILTPNSDLPRYAVQEIRLQLDARRVAGPGTYSARLLLYGGGLNAPLQTVTVTMRVPAASDHVTIQGVVRDSQSGVPLQARLALSQNGLAGEPITTSSDGSFAFAVVSGTAYTLVVTAPSYQELRQPLLESRDRVGDLALDLRLTPDLARLRLPAPTVVVTLPFATSSDQIIPLENSGTRPLFYQLELPDDGFSISRSDEAGGPLYSWVDLPATAAVLPAGNAVITDQVDLGFAFPFLGYRSDDATITSDGMLAFDRPLVYHGLTSNCLPDASLLFYVLAPLRLDIDTSKGGQVRYGHDSQRFVVSYEQVQLKDGAPNQVYTFQLILAADGRITYQYKQLGPLPNRASVGVQRSLSAYQQLGCGPSLPIHNELAIELRPQPAPALWLATTVVSGTLQPGEQALIPLHATWLRPTEPGSVLVARLRVTTNDPFAIVSDIPIRVAMKPAPLELWLPMSGR